MPEYDNNMRASAWGPTNGQYGEYISVKFEINGVKYKIALSANQYKQDGDKKPDWVGKVKLANTAPMQPTQFAPPVQQPVTQQQPQVAPQVVQQAPVQQQVVAQPQLTQEQQMTQPTSPLPWEAK